jgi:DNA polymerase III subunit alpha
MTYYAEGKCRHTNDLPLRWRYPVPLDGPAVFAHLHTHTEYSLLDGMSRIPALMDRVLALGQNAIAITDHGGMYGVIEFYQEARKRGIKPILGVEAYVAPGSRHSRDSREKNAYFHLGLLARNAAGYRNLVALTSKAHLEGFYYKPRMDRELLAEYGKGLIALSGCPSGEVFKALLDDRIDDAKATLGFYQDVFDAVFLEIQDHPGCDAELRRLLDTVNPRLIRLAKETGLELVATNDSHYTAPEDEEAHDILLCIGSNTTVQDTKRLKFEGGGYYLKSEEEMLRLFPDLPRAIHASGEVAAMCDIELEFGRVAMPAIDLPPGVSTDEHLRNLCYEGAKRRYGDLTDEVRQRLDYELEVIRVTGFAQYMLIVAEIVNEARRRRIPTGVRGSAAASIVLYTLGVTDIEPIGPKLIFERFLHAERKEMPDVDLDIADDRRDELIQWAADRWGRDRVAQIITFGTLGAKAAIRDVGRALGMGYGDVDRIARLVPTVLHMTIDRALAENNELRQLYESDAAARRVIDMAKRLEGVARHASTHAAGVIIAGQPLYDVAPLQKPSRADDNALPMVQFDMNVSAEVGLLKMDFLGLSNLTILGRAVDLIREYHGIELDRLTLPDDDAKTFDMLGKGETFGVFQLESSGMRRYIQELKPSSIAELAAMVALYRPGPMAHIPTFVAAKHGREPIRYPHQDLADILDETYGVIVYQDQVLFIMWKFAGYSMGEADKIRKAMSKKKPEVMAAEREKFVRGAQKQGYAEDDARAVFDLVEPFAGYAFPKAHAVCYGTISYQTAYLKANYPAEYMTAVLMLAESHPAGLAARVGAAVAECAKLGIEVLPPDVNHSGVNFRIESRPDGSKAIRFGLAMIKNVGEGAVEELIAAREEGGRFSSLEDFCRRAGSKALNKRMVESLAKAGALDCFGHARGTIVSNLDRVHSLMQREQRLKDSGQSTMFDLFGDQVPVPMPGLELQEVEVPRGEVLAWERELLGIYASDHPFKQAAAELAPHISAVISEVTAEMAGRDIVIAGLVTSTRPLLTRDGRTFIAAELEDLSGSTEVTVWPDVYEATRDCWQPGQVLLVHARVKARDEQRLGIGVTMARRWTEDDSLEDLPTPEPEFVSQTPTNGNGNGARRGRGGNGHANGSATPPPPQTAEQRGPRLLHITLRETDDEADDRRRLAQLVEALRSYPGSDEVRLTLRTAEDEHSLSLGTALVTDGIEQRLGPILRGWGELSVVPLR